MTRSNTLLLRLFLLLLVVAAIAAVAGGFGWDEPEFVILSSL